MIGVAAKLSQILTFEKNGIISSTYLDNAIVKGQVFQLQKRIIVPEGDGSTYYLIIDSSSLISTGKKLYILPLSMKTEAGLVYCDTYAVTSYSGGILVPFAKVNAAHSNVASCKAYKGVTVVGTAGDELREYVIGTKSTRQFSGSNTPTLDIAKQFPAGTIMTAKFTNKETFAATVEFGMIIVET